MKTKHRPGKPLRPPAGRHWSCTISIGMGTAAEKIAIQAKLQQSPKKERLMVAPD
jgi:hypothetical protein